MKKVYASETEGPSKRGRLLGRWEDRVKEYMCERGSSKGQRLEQAERVFG